MSLIIDYPWYFLLLCLLLGAAYSFVLYWLRLRRPKAEGDSGGETSPFPRRLKWLLSLLRTLAVAAIAFLLLAPLVRRESSRKEKPLVIIAEDNSKSLDYCRDSAYYHDGFQKEMSDLVADLSKDFDVRRYRYDSEVVAVDDGDELTGGLFSGQATDMSQLIDNVAELYYHRNVGAMIVTGDGIYNKGSNPLTAVGQTSFPIYTVAMGDTSVRYDAAIANVRFNRIAYLGNKFPMDVTVNASRLKGRSSTLTVTLDGKRLYSKNIEFTDDRFSTTESIVLDADKAGIHSYVVAIEPVAEEQTLRNNRRMVSIEVIDGHQKIAIISAVPHPDVAALKAAVERNINFEAEVFRAKEFDKNPKDYDLFILHQLPSKVAEANIDVAGLLKSGVPAIFVLGGQTDLARLNTLHAGLEVFSRIDRQNEVSALFSKEFTYFTLDEDKALRISQFPPLLSPFGEYKMSGNAQTLFVQKVGSVNSRLPLVAVTQQQERRYAFIAGEGLWRWRLADWQSNQTHDDFDQLIDKLVVFTALRVNKERFHIESKHLFGQSEDVRLEAQLYNDNYEPVNSPDVELVIKNMDGNSEGQRYLFNRSGTGYAINLGQLAPGRYSYSSSTRFNGKNYAVSGNFIVEELHLESVSLVADHSLLNTVASQSGGEMVDAHSLGRIPEMLRSREDMKTLIYSETRYSDMINMPLVFVLIVLLLGVEWVIRKYNGEV